MTKIYNKLVRDRIPEIIEKSGNKCVIEQLDDESYLKYLEEKLFEEAKEYQTDKSVEELADVLEVVYALAKTKGVSVSQLENLRKEKCEKRGGFENKIFLKTVEERE